MSGLGLGTGGVAERPGGGVRVCVFEFDFSVVDKIISERHC